MPENKDLLIHPLILALRDSIGHQVLVKLRAQGLVQLRGGVAMDFLAFEGKLEKADDGGFCVFVTRDENREPIQRKIWVADILYVDEKMAS